MHHRFCRRLGPFPAPSPEVTLKKVKIATGHSGFDYLHGREDAPAMHPDLADLLRHRLAVITDHAWRDRDAVDHLEALKEVSEKISAWTLENRSTLDPQLRHFLSNCSFDKALAHIGGAP